MIFGFNRMIINVRSINYEERISLYGNKDVELRVFCLGRVFFYDKLLIDSIFVGCF